MTIGIRPGRTTIASFDRATRNQAMDGGQLSLRAQRLYSLVLLDINATDRASAVVKSPGIDPAPGPRAVGGGGETAEFFFSVPPKVTEMQEPFATSIVPTQNGGKYVESQGSILKSIRVQGTTGLRPNKIAPNTIPLLQIPDQVLADLRPASALETRRQGIPEGEVTGFDDIMFLRNIFRLYSDRKAYDAAANRTVMVWRNAKDSDYWIVEPIDFKLSRNSSSPMTYEYSIELRTLAPFNFRLQEVADPLEEIMSRRRLLARTQGYAANLQRLLLSVAAGIDRIDGSGVAITTRILGPAVALTQGLLAIREAGTGLGSRTLETATTLLENVRESLVNLAEYDVVDAFTDTILSRLPPQDSTRRSLRRMQVVAARVLAEHALQDTVAAKGIAQRYRLAAQYAQAGDSRLTARTPSTGGSSTFIGNSSTPGSLGETRVHVGETVRDVAARVLGDRGRWHEIVLLNDLRYPFLSATGGDNVVAYGGMLVYPSTDAEGTPSDQVNSRNPSTRELDDGNTRLGAVTNSYGRDIRLQTVAAQTGDLEQTDFVINDAGDISTIAGIPNVEQAVRLKFATEQGELTVHRFYGSRFPIGSKADSSSFTAYQLDVRNTILSDKRVAAIQDLDMAAVGDVLSVSATIRLVNSSELLTTDFALRGI